MSDERLRYLERKWHETGDPTVRDELVRVEMRSSVPFVGTQLKPCIEIAWDGFHDIYGMYNPWNEGFQHANVIIEPRNCDEHGYPLVGQGIRWRTWLSSYTSVTYHNPSYDNYLTRGFTGPTI